jgi:predicted alpha/beta superfamily hydrolase
MERAMTTDNKRTAVVIGGSMAGLLAIYYLLINKSTKV